MRVEPIHLSKALSSDSMPAAASTSSLGASLVAEGLGTFILVLFGTGAVHSAVLTGAQMGLGQIAAVWAIAVALGIWIASPTSGAHLNPAVTLACACWRGFSWRRVVPYLAGQTVGAFLAAALLYALFGGAIGGFERDHGIVRGEPGSERSAMVFGEYFPNPAGSLSVEVTRPRAMLAEGFGTLVLVLSIFALTDQRNTTRPPVSLVPLIIGVTVAMIISVIAPLTQAGLNPARDFGPRLFAWLAGWSSIAIPGPRGGFLSVYVLAPLLGAVAGGGLWEWWARVPATAGGAVRAASRPKIQERKVV
jgi:glycerol uptake facilitator protein